MRSIWRRRWQGAMLSVGGLSGRLLPWLYFCWAVVLGSVVSWLVPPWQNPDEPAHAARIVQIALGRLVASHVGDISGGISDPAINRSQGPMSGVPFHPEVKYTTALAHAAGAVRWGEPDMMWFPNTALYPPLLYLPMVPAVWIGRAGRMHVVATLRLMRFCGLLAAAGIGAAALAVARRTRPALLAVLLLPMSVALAASSSQDALLIPVACLAAALLDRTRSRPQPAGSWTLGILALSVLAATLARPSNLPLGFTLLLLPLAQRRAAVLLTVGVVGASLAWTLYTLTWISVPMFEARPDAQAAALLQQPTLFLLALLASLRQWGTDYLAGMVGIFGWLDTALPPWFYRIAGLILLVSLLCAGAPEPGARRVSRWLALACAGGSVLLVFLALYVGWSPPRGDHVLGVQGRYFLPLLPALALGLPNLGRWTAWLRPAAMTAAVLLAAITPVVVVANPGRTLLPDMIAAAGSQLAVARTVMPHSHDAQTRFPAKFEQRAPSLQNAVDIFAGKWASNLEPVMDVVGTGRADLFEDPRPQMAADALGRARRLDGLRVLELGPLEAGHTFLLAQLGAAEIIAVEANTEAFLKCLVVKEALGLQNARFLCGDILAYLAGCDARFDLIFCSGVLYHMADPLELIQQVACHTDRCFVWTHYHTSEPSNDRVSRTARAVSRSGFAATYYEMEYADAGSGQFWGGNRPVQAWMDREQILAAFAHFGLAQRAILDERLDHPAGRCMSFAVWR